MGGILLIALLLVEAGFAFAASELKAYGQDLILMLLIVTLLRAPGLATAPGTLWIVLTSLVMTRPNLVSRAPG